MAASAQLLLSALSKQVVPGEPADGEPLTVTLPGPLTGDIPGPLTSEPPLADAAPLTSEPPLAEAAPLTSEPTAPGTAGGSEFSGV
ncbi:hypothetical protein OG875_21295 [Streptomyces sp. NBC_01498]|uniref:hypothetical protein n=1 Tax=Streptomyces sp. NBC_01498 TaxID=2975870 RepID=UPI002E7B88F6|nr:hypothetical protein [Streptomyces sp. NBC_01498]WTL26875.1 hypothetical protein OG875_21295 [Streptomyces sp. NBC_01498]